MEVNPTMVMDDKMQDEEEELQEIKDYLKLFNRKVRNSRIRDEIISYRTGYKNWKEYEEVREVNYGEVKKITILKNHSYNDPTAWNFYMDFEDRNRTRKTVKLSFYQMKIGCPNVVAFYVNFNHPEWPVEYRQMVPLGDH